MSTRSMVRNVTRPMEPRSFGAVDTSQWWIGAGFWSQWAGSPPCPDGATLSDDGQECHYRGRLAERQGDPKWDKPLDQWVAAHCAAGQHVMLSEPYYDTMLEKEFVKALSSPKPPARTDLGGQGPPLTIAACASPHPGPPGPGPSGEQPSGQASSPSLTATEKVAVVGLFGVAGVALDFGMRK